MSAGKHTPGPWRSIQRIICEASERCGTVAQVFGEGDRSEANAALIAAGPDMLDALEEISRELMCKPGDTFAGGVCLHCIAQAAISKAKGKS